MRNLAVAKLAKSFVHATRTIESLCDFRYGSQISMVQQPLTGEIRLQ